MSLADLTTEEIAAFQLIEQGFMGITNGVTLIRAKDAKTEKAQRLYDWICLAQNSCTDPELYELMKEYLEEQLSQPLVAVLAVFKPGIEAGSYHVEPVARLLADPSEVIEPVFEHTDGAGNVIEDSGTDDNSATHSGSKGNGADT
jgi:hypothetical protein